MEQYQHELGEPAVSFQGLEELETQESRRLVIRECSHGGVSSYHWLVDPIRLMEGLLVLVFLVP
jgi:hypothetical protein